tara:strand:- start:1596 stop:2303 length:708 start_codon:yes stop_codon:yes gene_type:complete
MRKFTLLPLIFLYLNSFSQNSLNKNSYSFYDSLVGVENTEIFNGPRFLDILKSTKDNHRYFNSLAFVRGYIIYNSQLYNHINLRYDLINDDVIVVSSGDKGFFDVRLIRDKVQEFGIQNHHFIKLPEDKATGFYEVGYIGAQVSLYIKHQKSTKERLNKRVPYFEFFKTSFYQLRYNGKLYKIESSRDVEAIIPDKREQIRDFHSTYAILSKSKPDAYIVKLITYLDNNLSIADD